MYIVQYLWAYFKVCSTKNVKNISISLASDPDPKGSGPAKLTVNNAIHYRATTINTLVIQ
jgi:hypothetical protein